MPIKKCTHILYVEKKKERKIKINDLRRSRGGVGSGQGPDICDTNCSGP